jgi:hypothetical protein
MSKIVLFILLLVSTVSAQPGMPFGMVHAVESDTTGLNIIAEDSVAFFFDASRLGTSAKNDGDTVGFARNWGSLGSAWTRANSNAVKYYSNQINGHPAVASNNVGDYLSYASTAVSAMSNDTMIHIFAVFKTDSAQSGGYFGFTSTTARIYLAAGSSLYTYYANSNAFKTYLIPQTNSWRTLEWHKAGLLKSLQKVYQNDTVYSIQAELGTDVALDLSLSVTPYIFTYNALSKSKYRLAAMIWTKKPLPADRRNYFIWWLRNRFHTW